MTELSSANKTFKDLLMPSPSYILADRDTEFLRRDELRSVRIELELLKQKLNQREQGIRSTIVVFASARLQDTAAARETLQLVDLEAARRPNDGSCRPRVALARRQLKLCTYYDVVREFGLFVSSSCQVDGRSDYVIVTGRGPGIIEAAYRGAADTHAKSIGLNITLPREQHPNPYISYITPELSFRFVTSPSGRGTL